MQIFILISLWMLAEIAGFVVVGGWLGLGGTLMLVVLAALVGILVIRAQGEGAMSDVRGQVAQMRNPVSLMAHRGLLVLAGGLLFLPGFLSDLAGLALLIPAVRRAIILAMSARIKRGMADAAMVKAVHVAAGQMRTRPGPAAEAPPIEADYSEIEPTTHQNRPGTSGWTQH